MLCINLDGQTDLGHVVAGGELAPDAEQILGYVAIPEPDTPEAEEPEGFTPEADESPPVAETAPAETEPESITETQAPLVTYRAEAPSGIQVCAAAAEGVFPADTLMKVTDVPREEALQAAAGGLPADMGTLDAVAVDISFHAADGTELEPAGGVDVQITLPETQQLAGETFTLLHVEDDGAVETVEAEITGDAVTFTAERFSIYIWTNYNNTNVDPPTTVNGYLDITNALPGNSESNPYVIEIGETIFVRTISSEADIIMAGYRSGISVDKNDFTENGVAKKRIDRFKKEYDDIQLNSDGTYTVRAFFVGANPGDCQIYARRAQGESEKLYVRVVEPTIYVRTALGDVSKNKVHEYLERTYHSADNQYIYTLDDAGNCVPTYIKNTTSNDGKYLLYGGESVILVGKSEDSSLRFQTTSPNVTIGTQTVENDGSIVAEITMNNVTNDVPATITFGNDTFELYIRAVPETMSYKENCNHADIEITDGGTYVITTTDAQNNVTKITYDAVVSNVNHCYIYDINNNMLEYFFPKDYEPNGQLGVTQYELTSQNNPAGPKSIDRRRIDHAEFDISLYLNPVSKTVNGTPVAMTQEEQIPLVADSVIFNLDKRSVLDAFNKCPDRTGFDFTLKANLNDLITVTPTTASTQATKAYTNGSLQVGQFSFELHRVNYALVKSQQVGEDWQINLNDCFPAIDPTHTYRAYQINDLDANGGNGWWGSGVNQNSNAYDSAMHSVQSTLQYGTGIGDLINDIEFDITPANDGDLNDVSVTNLSLTANDGAGSLTGTVVNNQGATLPSTGGIGTTIFYVVGGTLVAGAVVLLITKKRMSIHDQK